MDLSSRWGSRVDWRSILGGHWDLALTSKLPVLAAQGHPRGSSIWERLTQDVWRRKRKRKPTRPSHSMCGIPRLSKDRSRVLAPRPLCSRGTSKKQGSRPSQGVPRHGRTDSALSCPLSTLREGSGLASGFGHPQMPGDKQERAGRGC